MAVEKGNGNGLRPVGTTCRQPVRVNCSTCVVAAVNVKAIAPSPPVLRTVLAPPSSRAASYARRTSGQLAPPTPLAITQSGAVARAISGGKLVRVPWCGASSVSQLSGSAAAKRAAASPSISPVRSNLRPADSIDSTRLVALSLARLSLRSPLVAKDALILCE